MKKDKTYDFQKFKTTTSFGRGIYNNELTLENEFEKQIKFKKEINKFKESTKPKTLDKKRIADF